MLANMTVFSRVLDKSCDITLVGPKLFCDTQPYKVAYVLHGLTGNSANWLEYTLLPLMAKDGNTIYVLPDAGRSWYTNSKHGQSYFTYIAEELPCMCKSLFNISAKRENTLVMGNSMGGYGALKCALTYPEKYGICCAFSPAALFWRDYLAMPNCASLMREFEGIFGKGLNIPPQDEIMQLAKNALNAEQLPKIRVSCGKSDFLVDLNRRFAKEMSQLKFDFAYNEWDGEHDWTFWNKSLGRVIDEFGC